MESWFNDLRYNDIPGITINILLPSKSYSKMYGAKPQYNDPWYNDKINITDITGNVNIWYNKTNFGYINSNYKLFLTCFKDIEEYSGLCTS